MLIFSFFFSLISSAPFGIDPSLEKAYQEAINQNNNSFTCLDGSMTIPLSSLNDGKCDCPDSSDEPGTSACLNGHFYCHNPGGKPKLIPSHKVNDGYCDCCDGSDEYDNPNAQCPNICSDLVTMAHNSRESIYQKIRAGIRRLSDFIKETQSDYSQAQRDLRELRVEVNKLEHEISILNRKKKEKKKLYKEAKRAAKGISPEQHAEEKRLKHEYVYKPRKKKTVTFQEDPDGLDVPFDESQQSIDWDVDESVEEEIYYATPRPEPYRRNKADSDNNFDFMRDEERIHHRQEKWKKMKKEKKEQNKNTGEETFDLLSKMKTKVNDLSEKIFGSDKLKTFEEFQEASKECDKINSQISNARVSILSLENKLKHPLGPNNVWFPLSEKEFKLTRDGYDYNFNMLQFIQYRESGTNWYLNYLGEFRGWNETNFNRTMIFEGGTPCWQGPMRRAEVYLYCGPSNKFLDMEELDRCIYRGHFETPLACDEGYLDWVKKMSDLELVDFVTQWEKVE